MNGFCFCPGRKYMPPRPFGESVSPNILLATPNTFTTNTSLERNARVWLAHAQLTLCSTILLVVTMLGLTSTKNPRSHGATGGLCL